MGCIQVLLAAGSLRWPAAGLAAEAFRFGPNRVRQYFDMVLGDPIAASKVACRPGLCSMPMRPFRTRVSLAAFRGSLPPALPAEQLARSCLRLLQALHRFISGDAKASGTEEERLRAPIFLVSHLRIFPGPPVCQSLLLRPFPGCRGREPVTCACGSSNASCASSSRGFFRVFPFSSSFSCQTAVNSSSQVRSSKSAQSFFCQLSVRLSEVAYEAQRCWRSG